MGQQQYLVLQNAQSRISGGGGQTRPPDVPQVRGVQPQARHLGPGHLARQAMWLHGAGVDQQPGGEGGGHHVQTACRPARGLVLQVHPHRISPCRIEARIASWSIFSRRFI